MWLSLIQAGWRDWRLWRHFAYLYVGGVDFVFLTIGWSSAYCDINSQSFQSNVVIEVVALVIAVVLTR
jgi:hypothetical protein